MWMEYTMRKKKILRAIIIISLVLLILIIILGSINLETPEEPTKTVTQTKDLPTKPLSMPPLLEDINPKDLPTS